MKKESKILSLLFLLIIGLSFISYRQFSKFQKSIQEIDLPEFQLSTTEDFFPKEKKEEREFLSPDGKLKIKYPASWEEGGEMFDQLFSPPGEDSANIKLLFFGYKISWQNSIPSYLIIQESTLIDSEKIIEALKKETEAEGGKMEILKLEDKAKGILFEARYKIGEISSVHSQGKIIIMEEKSYLINIYTLEENWENVAKEAGDILASLEILE